MKPTFSIAAITFLTISLCCGMIKKTEIKEITYVPRGILIFLDDSEEQEKKMWVISGDLITALYQHAGPIIASTSLLRNIFSGDKIIEQELAGKNAKELVREYNYSGDEKKQNFIIAKALAFDEGQWIIKEISEFLCLLIPHTYVQSLKIDASTVAKTSSNDNISAVELQLGLKVNHMKPTSIAEITKQPADEPPSDYFVDALYNKQTKKSNIFCVRSDYRAHNVTSIPLWTIYMGGHGILASEIVGISLDGFQQVLDFFEHSIATRLLIYNSCYAAGLNNELIYKDAKSGIDKTYSFVIITNAITNAPTQIVLPLLQEKQGQLQLNAFTHYDDFLADVHASSTNYEVLAQHLFPFFHPERSEELRGRMTTPKGNVPQIKLPGVEWFSVMASQREIVSIGSILAKTFDVTKSLDITKFFKTDPRILLLYADNIPFELVLSGYRLEAIISMAPRDSMHKFKKISYPHGSIRSFVQLFMSIEKLAAHKIFFIEEVIIIPSKRYQDVVIYNEKILNKPDAYAFYRDGNTLYAQKAGTFSAKVATPDQTAHYHDLLKKIRGETIQEEMPKIITVERAEAHGRLFQPFTQSTRIEKIISQEDVNDIVFELKLAVMNSPFKDIIVWVDEIEGSKIKDLVIDGSDYSIYYTKGDNFYRDLTKLDKDYREEYKRRLSLPVKKRHSFEISTEDVEKLKKTIAAQAIEIDPKNS